VLKVLLLDYAEVTAKASANYTPRALQIGSSAAALSTGFPILAV
jgi:hypothetical protein